MSSLDRVRALLASEGPMTADEISGRLGNADSTIKVLLYGSARTAGLACSGEGLWYVLDQSTTPYKPTSPQFVAARTERPGKAQVAQSPNTSVSDHSVGASEARGASPAGGIVDDQLWTTTLKNLREKLLDLRRTNRLINYREGARDIAIVEESPGQVHEQLLIDSLELALDPKPEPLPDETDTPPPEPGAGQTEQQPVAGPTAHPQGALGLSGGRLRSKRELHLQTVFTAKALEKRCQKLFREARAAIEETGANLLHLAIGFLEWYENAESEVPAKAPLILIPLRITRGQLDRHSNCYSYQISYSEEDLEVNLSLKEKLAQDFSVVLPASDPEDDPEDYFLQVAEAVRDQPRWQVRRDMCIGLFSFAKQVMWRDLDEANWPETRKLRDSENLRRILLGADSSDTPGQITEEYEQEYDPRVAHVPLVLDADNSQFSALVDVLAERRDLVVEGPPGTGKSQTITNLIAAAINQGKTVLFVAEKLAALEVVRRRLDQIGLGDFCLELHSHKTHKQQLHEDLRRRLELSFSDAPELETQQRDLLQTKSELIELSESLKAPVGPESVPLHDVFWRVERLRGTLGDLADYELPVADVEDLEREQFMRRLNALNDLEKQWDDLAPEARRAWHGFLPSDLYSGDERAVLAACRTLTAPLAAVVDGLDASGIRLADLPSARWDGLAALACTEPGSVPPPDTTLHPEVVKALSTADGLAIGDLLVSRIGELDALRGAVSTCFDGQPHDLEQSIPVARAASAVVAECGLVDQTLVQVGTLLNRWRAWESAIASLTDSLTRLQGFFDAPLQTVGDVTRAATLCELAKDAPVDLSLHGHPTHVKELGRRLFEQAQGECAAVATQLAELAELYNLRHVPEPETLRDLAEVVSANVGVTRVFKSDWRKAKASLKRFVRNKSVLKEPDLATRLETLADVIEHSQRLSTQTDYRTALGSLYQGTDTDWDRLLALVAFGQELRTTLGSTARAVEVLGAWDDSAEVISGQASAVAAGSEAIGYLAERMGADDHADSPLEAFMEAWFSRREALGNAYCSLAALDMDAGHAIEEIVQSCAAHELASACAAEIAKDGRAASICGPLWRAGDTDVAELTRHLSWVRQLMTQTGIESATVLWICAESPATRTQAVLDLSAVGRNLVAAHSLAVEALEKYGVVDRDRWLKPEAGETLIADIQTTRDTCEAQIDSLGLIADWSRTRNKVVELDVAPIADQAIPAGPARGRTAQLYDFAVHSAICKNRLRSNPNLAAFNRAGYESITKRFRALDKAIMESTAKRTAKLASRRSVPYGNGRGPVGTFSELALLRHELSKKRRHIPIRRLTGRAPNALQGLKPCFMMSPMSVAQYLPRGGIQFDLVIMDEASQLRPQEALGAIARARQLVVVGDPKQLPPTSFFEKIGAGLGEEDEMETAGQDAESILDVCLTQFPYRRLRWHYRSEHEDLIRFSNEQFYDGDLIVFPSPYGNHRSYGVHWNFVENARYLKSRNQQEAEAVVEKVIAHFRHHPGQSLGVATFNSRHAEEIELLLQEARKALPDIDAAIRLTEDAAEPFFVKNLENVQGDERDVMFLATTYGPDADSGRVYQRFGPINSDIGWRRLNVIVTRAKKRVEVFSSMRPTDVLVGENTRRGVRALRDYLEYAETGRVRVRGGHTGRGYDSEFERAVAQVTSQLGYETVPQVGVTGFFVDLGVQHPDRPGEFLLGIECDGAAYHSAKSVRDRDRLRQEILESKGWRIHRIWSTDWFKNRRIEIERLREKIELVLAEQRALDRRESSIEHEIRAGAVETERLVTQVADDEEKLVPDLREVLVRYRDANLGGTVAAGKQSILADEIIEYIERHLPSTREEFIAEIPLWVREKIDPEQARRHLPQILELVDEYA